jgi:hypothetical protein
VWLVGNHEHLKNNNKIEANKTKSRVRTICYVADFKVPAL